MPLATLGLPAFCRERMVHPFMEFSPTPEHVEGQRDTASFAETALRLAGKGEEEVRTLGAVDRADEIMEKFFRPEYQTTSSPIHRIIWDTRDPPLRLFRTNPLQIPPDAQAVIDRSLAVVREHQQNGTLKTPEGKISPALLHDLGRAGYWGMLIPKEYGGTEAPLQVFESLVTRMATKSAMVAGLASIHGCIGAVDPIRTFGSPDLKARYLPLLAQGDRLSGFALTEPNAGSDLTALRTTAELHGDHYIVNGEKLFITNAVPGHTIGLVCMIDGKPSVLIVDLPEEDEHFQLKHYGLYALKEARNNGLIFQDFPVPKENRVVPPFGDGLTIAYHGLNYGRVSIGAIAAGNLRTLLADMLPWVHFRRTYGQPIVQRELVRRRMGELAGLIVTTDALVQWSAGILDQGYRGEMECIVTKNFGSEAVKYAAIELYMRTHGGRSFLKGHFFGDEVHELLAPSIYEGERDMLSMAFFKALAKEHGREFFEPMGKAIQEHGLKTFHPMHPGHLWHLREELAPYVRWQIKNLFRRRSLRELPPTMPGNLRAHAEFALDALQRSAADIDSVMRTHQLQLPDRQLQMVQLSQRVQDMIPILVTSLSAAEHGDEITQHAADIGCDQLRQKLTGTPPSPAFLRKVTHLGEMVADGGFSTLAGMEPREILMRY